MKINDIFNMIAQRFQIDNLTSPYIQSLVILMGFFFLSWVVYEIFQKILLKLALRTKTDIDDKIIQKTRNPAILILLLIGLILSLYPLRLGDYYLNLAINFILTVITIISVMILYRINKIVVFEMGDLLAKKQNQQQMTNWSC